MIGKGGILLRIQYLQKSACRISVIGLGQLIHFVKHHYRIVGVTFAYTVYYPARH